MHAEVTDLIDRKVCKSCKSEVLEQRGERGVLQSPDLRFLSAFWGLGEGQST